MALHDRALTIGVDFDNTIASYDALLQRLVEESGFVRVNGRSGKRALRDAIRARPDGEARWQQFQAEMYGPRIMEALPAPGAGAFLQEARARGAAVHVVSHKTVKAAAAPGGPDLRQAARRWLEANGFFDPPISLEPGSVYFEDDRASKVRRIASLGCTHFIDDLEETYLEPSFPADVVPILLAADGSAPPGVHVCRSWDEIHRLVLG